jgi:nucleoside-diphosphate-sugar epimerase
MSKVLVTGASGFVGGHLCDMLATVGYQVIGTTRSSADRASSPDIEFRTIGDISGDLDWNSLLQDIDIIVHLAARVHVMSESAEDPLAEFRRVNSLGTAKLAESAATAGVKRLVYVSTIKVLGEKTDGQPFTNFDVAAPCDPYGVSKLEAEEALARIANNTGLEIVTLRPPLVYGPGVGGNFLRILGLVYKGIPLPLGAIKNARSLLAVSNLCHVIQICLDHPDAAGKTFLVADGENISTSGLFKMIGRLMDKPARLLPFPEKLLRLFGRILGRSGEVARLCDSLQVDIDHTRDVLGWSPQTSLEEGLDSVVRWYLQEGHQSNE